MKRWGVVLLCVWLASGLAPAHAAKGAMPKVVVTDPAGDANGLNDEGYNVLASQFPPPGRSLGAQPDDAMDILGVGFATEISGKGKKRAPSRIDVRLQLKKAPDPSQPVPRLYRVIFDTPGCSQNTVSWNMTPHNPPPVPDELGNTAAIWTHTVAFSPGAGCPTNTAIDLSDYSAIVGDSLVWKIPVIPMFGTNKKVLGKKVSAIRAESRFRFRLSYPYPVADVAQDPSKSYVIGK